MTIGMDILYARHRSSRLLRAAAPENGVMSGHSAFRRAGRRRRSQDRWMIYRAGRREQYGGALQQCEQQLKAGATSMFTKTLIALLTATVLSVSFVSAQAQTNSRGCVSHSMDEGTLSAYPAWRVC
jgi:hypothetical protein